MQRSMLERMSDYLDRIISKRKQNSKSGENNSIVDSGGLVTGVMPFIRACYRRLTGMKASVRIALLVLLCLVAVFLFIMYGPFKTVSDMYITTAMHTSDHQYLAKMLYSDDYINEVLSRNNINQVSGVGSISCEVSSTDAVELHEITGEGYHGWMLVVDDPGRIDIVPSIDGGEPFNDSDEDLPDDEFGMAYIGNGELIEEIAGRYDAFAAVNASGYVNNSWQNRPNGLVIYDHRQIHSCDDEIHSYIAITDENNLVFGVQCTKDILAQDYRDVLEFGPMLILNGVPSEISGNGGGVAARTVIGQTASGEVLLLVIDGMQFESLGATFMDVQKIMLSYGAVNALALDGGASSCVYYDGEVINSPSQGIMGRFLPNAIIVSGGGDTE